MDGTVECIHAEVSRAVLDKADRLFRNDDAGIWAELLQNARRAGAKSVDVTIEPCEGDASRCLITIQDDGCGIENFQKLLTLGGSDWSADVQQAEDPAGMGFFSLCRSDVEVRSGGHVVTITPMVFAGKSTAPIQKTADLAQGTWLRFTRASAKSALIAALEKVTEFCPLAVRLNGQVLPRCDFLEGALYRELIDGIEVGFATQFQWDWHWHDEPNWNFYGVRLREPFPSFTGLLDPANPTRLPLALHARFNVVETGHIKLQLPDRRSIIQDEFLQEFLNKARAAAYRFFAAQPSHLLSFKSWQEARALGITLPEAGCVLTSWHAEPHDDSIEPMFGSAERRLLTDLAGVVLVERDLPNRHTLEAALQGAQTTEYSLYEEQVEYCGYSWYDALPRITDTAAFLDGQSFAEWHAEEGRRPKTIELETTIEQTGCPDRTLRIPAFIHVESDNYNELDFVAVSSSPWDNDKLDGPFPVTEFLVWSTFYASDDYGQCDSWETQHDGYRKEVERAINEYFRGPRATLLAILEEAIGWEANELAKRLNIEEIRFRRIGTGPDAWQVELELPRTPPIDSSQIRKQA